MPNFKDSDITSMESRYRARLINSLSGFKSANLLSTISSNGIENLCVISSAFHLGADPALLGFIVRPDSVQRDTLSNLREIPYCTLNHINKEIVERAHQTSARYPSQISEFKECLLTPQYKEDMPAPYVKESHIQLGLKMIREQQIPENGTHLIISKILSVSIPDDSLREDGSVDIALAKSLSVSGLDEYHEAKTLGRLSYAKPDKKLEWL